MTASLSCPICHGKDLQTVGTIFHQQPLLVAQVPLVLEQERFEYVRCQSCSFHFKTPEIPAEALLRCYAAAKGDRWGHDVNPIERNFDRVVSSIGRTHASGRILDIGCSNGAFLRNLNGDWKRYGIEPSAAARQMAEQSGINILAPTIEQLSEDLRFDVIIAMDVMEHIPDPCAFMSRLTSHMVSGGIFVITTGNTDAWSWKLQKERYWYCATFPEHVSFYNRRSAQMLGKAHGLDLISFEAMSYKRAPLATRMSQHAKGALFGVGQSLKWMGIPALNRRFSKRAGTNWASANDHMIAILQSPDAKS